MQALAQTVLRVLQLLWIILLTALIGNVIANNVNAASSAEAAVNFSMFVVVLSWLAALYGLVTAFVESISMAVVLLALDALATLFTFIAAVVLAAKVRAVNCSALDANDLGGDWIGFGSFDTQKRCRELQASTAFMWFLFACFVGTLALTALGWRRGGGGSVRSSAPTMSQFRV